MVTVRQHTQPPTAPLHSRLLDTSRIRARLQTHNRFGGLNRCPPNREHSSLPPPEPARHPCPTRHPQGREHLRPGRRTRQLDRRGLHSCHRACHTATVYGCRDGVIRIPCDCQHCGRKFRLHQVFVGWHPCE